MALTHLVHDLSTASTKYRAVASLHAHTHCSHESLAFLPGWAARVPVLRSLMHHGLRTRRGRPAVDFSRMYWCPPLSPQAVIESERAQAASRLHLPTMVSLTDHDNIDASLVLRPLGAEDAGPISFEWTLPYRGQVFHLGLHNLPDDQSREILSRCQAITAAPSERAVAEVLSDLHGNRSSLVVLNHPLWNAYVDENQDQSTLAAFLRSYRPFLHATELNGYRSHDENRGVLELGRQWDLPVVAGGDRHGRAPNAMLNLTFATTFEEFVDEVRQQRRSHVVVLPEYRQHPATRVLEVLSDVLADDRRLEARQRRWTQRIFVIDDAGRHRPLDEVWRYVPLWVRVIPRVAAAISATGTRQALRLGLVVDNGGVL